MNSLRSRPELYRSVIHPLMSISISVTGILAFSWMVSTLLNQGAPRFVTIIGIVLAGVLEAVAGNILYKERAGIGNRVRELIMYLIVAYGALSITRPGPVAERFEPGFAQIPGMIAIALCWLVAFAFHNRLRGREALLRTFSGKRGEALRRAVLDRQHDMALTVGHLRKARKIITSLFVVLCVLGIFATFEFMPTEALTAASGAFVMLVLYGISSISVAGALNSFIEEYAANGEGLAIPARMGRRRGALVVIIVSTAVVLGFALSRSESLLPIEIFGRFFEWLGSLFAREPAEQTVTEMPPPPQADLPPDVLQELRDMEPVVPPLWVRLLATILRRAVLAAAIVIGVVLVFGPLLSPSFRKGLGEIKPRAFLKRLWSLLRTRWRMLKHALRLFARGGWRRSRRSGEGAEQDGSLGRHAGARWKPSIRKRRQMDRVVAVFASVAKWGGRHGVPYVHSLAASEYLRRIATLRPEHYADTKVLSDVFARARFSQELIGRSEMSAYFAAAKRVTRSE